MTALLTSLRSQSYVLCRPTFSVLQLSLASLTSSMTSASSILSSSLLTASIWLSGIRLKCWLTGWTLGSITILCSKFVTFPSPWNKSSNSWSKDTSSLCLLLWLLPTEFTCLSTPNLKLESLPRSYSPWPSITYRTVVQTLSPFRSVTSKYPLHINGFVCP